MTEQGKKIAAEFGVAEKQTQAEREMAYEIHRLRRIIAKELTENDELGSEFVYVNALKEEIAKLRDSANVWLKVAQDNKDSMNAWATECKESRASCARLRAALELYTDIMDECAELSANEALESSDGQRELEAVRLCVSLFEDEDGDIHRGVLKQLRDAFGLGDKS